GFTTRAITTVTGPAPCDSFINPPGRSAPPYPDRHADFAIWGRARLIPNQTRHRNTTTDVEFLTPMWPPMWVRRTSVKASGTRHEGRRANLKHGLHTLRKAASCALRRSGEPGRVEPKGVEPSTS